MNQNTIARADRDSMVARYGHIVTKIVDRTALSLPRSVAKDDLRQWGMIGLLDAIDRWDPSRGDFEAYAVPRIRGAVIDGARNESWLSRSEMRRWREASMATVDGTWAGPQLRPVGDMTDIDLTALHKAMTVEACPDMVVEAAAERQAVLDAIALMPEREQIVLILHYVEDLFLKEIAQLMEASESVVKRLHQSALSRLRRLLTEKGYQERPATATV
jgi:RNA polymerase sigma factor for flagellar operon FliA